MGYGGSGNVNPYRAMLAHRCPMCITPSIPVDGTTGGKFCDKGYSYRSVAFFKSDEQRKLINKSKRKIEQRFNKKVVTYVIKFDKFYEAENYHQDYYRKKFLNYLRYKKACGREKKLNSIWNK